MTQATIHQRLRDEHGLAASVASLKRYVAANLPEEVRRDQVVVLRTTRVEPGEEAQIDYGHLGYWVDPVAGRRRKVWAFVMVLACSRHMFVRPVMTMDQRGVDRRRMSRRSRSSAVSRLGSCRTTSRTGVDRPDLYDPKINRSYAELAEHYGVLVDPARVRKPRDKARVERPMPYVRDSFWRGREFASLAADAGRGAGLVLRGRRVRGLPAAGRARRPASVFAAVEAEALRPLPRRPFVLATWSTREGRPGHPRQGRQDDLLGAVAADRPERRRPGDRRRRCSSSTSGQLVATHGRKATGQTDRPVALPAGEDRVPDAHPDLVPHPRRRDRSGCVAVIDGLLVDQRPVSGCAPRKASSAWPTSTAPARLEAACAQSDRRR